MHLLMCVPRVREHAVAGAGVLGSRPLGCLRSWNLLRERTANSMQAHGAMHQKPIPEEQRAKQQMFEGYNTTQKCATGARGVPSRMYYCVGQSSGLCQRRNVGAQPLQSALCHLWRRSMQR